MLFLKLLMQLLAAILCRIKNKIRPKYEKVPRPLSKIRKTLILDLDETLVFVSPFLGAKAHFHVSLRGFDDLGVLKRPHLDTFLRKVSEWYNICIFTAALQEYADPIIDRIDPHSLFSRRFYRQVCTY